jgi:DNA-binding NtrC family response regulator
VASTAAQRARRRARALRERGDLDGARKALEAALEEATDLERAKLEAELNELKETRESLATRDPAAPPAADEDGIVGTAPSMLRLRAQIAKAAASAAPLLIEGPSGAGKELVARAVHRRSERAHLPFVAVSAAGLNAGLVEDELFGHAPGAFTGAIGAREGLLAAAKDGTLLLDLVDDLPLDVQAKLIRVLEGGEVRPLGGGPSVRLEARVIATARRPLGPLVRSGEFREELLFRLNVLSIEVPPLRERKDDVPALAASLLERHTQGRRPPRIEKPALEKLQAYPWPGNVRELENELRRLLALKVDPIVVPCLNPSIRSGKGASEKDLSTGLYEKLRGRTMDDVEKVAILAALRSCNGNRTQAAKLLKVSRRALYDKLRRYGIEPSAGD